MDVAELIEEMGRAPSATARATGLSRMTVHRLRDGVSTPTLATLRELALAAGYDIDVALVPASDPAAAVAARVMADPATPPLDHLEEWGTTYPDDIDAVSTWVARLERQGGHNPRRLLELAGRSAAPQHRKGGRFFAPKPGLSQEQIVEIANSALRGLTGALSGMAAARAYLGHAPDPGPVVLWTNDVDAVATRLAATLREADEYQPAGILLAPTMPAYFIDVMMPPAWNHHIVSPIQAAIDLHGLGYEELANEITEGW